MARSPKQIKEAAQIQAVADSKKLAILHEVLSIITDECELKAVADENECTQYFLVIEKFKPEFEVSTRELLETINDALFPSDSIHKISDHYFKCMIESAGGMTNRMWFGADMSTIRKQLFMDLLGISDDSILVDSCRVNKSKSILVTNQPIRILL